MALLQVGGADTQGWVKAKGHAQFCSCCRHNTTTTGEPKWLPHLASLQRPVPKWLRTPLAVKKADQRMERLSNYAASNNNNNNSEVRSYCRPPCKRWRELLHLRCIFSLVYCFSVCCFIFLYISSRYSAVLAGESKSPWPPWHCDPENSLGHGPVAFCLGNL